MLPYRDSRFIKIVLGAFFIIALGYTYYEARGFLFGPSITLLEETQTVREQFVSIRGTAERIAELKVNGAPVPVTEAGAFEEPYLLAPGVNRIILHATDKYGRSVERHMTIIYEPVMPPAPTVVSTSTAKEQAPPADMTPVQ